MTPQAKTAGKEMESLVGDTCRLYVGRPDQIATVSQDADDGSVYVGLKGAVEDEPRLVGKGGAHVDAIAFLVNRIGLHRSKPYTFRMITSKERRGTWDESKDAIGFDPEPVRQVVFRWLEAIGMRAFTVTVGPGAGPRSELRYTITVTVADRAAATGLTAPAAEIAGQQVSTIGALGTLVRAMGRQHGVKFQIDIADHG